MNIFSIFTVLITQPLANGLVLTYNIFGQNLGIAIIVFSTLLRFVLNPLTKPYMNSMKKIRQFQPELEKLKKRHKDDKVKLAQAQADFYKDKGINPSAGCLPYLLQIVILITFFNLFNRVLKPDINIAEQFNQYLYEPLKFASDAQININFLGLNLTKPNSHQIGLPFAFPGVLLFLAAISQFLSAKITQPYIEQEEEVAKATPDKSDDFAAMFQTQAIYIFPMMTLFIGLSFPSGLALYWLVFSILQMYQQYTTSGWGGLTPYVKKIKSFKV